MQANGIYQVWPNVFEVCQGAIFYSLAGQLVMRFVNRVGLKSEANTVKMRLILDEFYKAEEIKYAELLTSRLKFTEFAMKSYLVACFIVYHIPITTTWLISILENKFLLYMPAILPFTNPEETFDFILNGVILTMVTTIVYLMLVSEDLYYIYFASETAPMVDIFIIKLQEIGLNLVKLKECKRNKFCRVPKNSKFHSQNQDFQEEHENQIEIDKFETKFIDLIKTHRDLNKYIKDVHDYMKLSVFIALSLNAISIGLSIIVLRFISVPIGFGISLIFLFQVLMPCTLGALISHLNQRLLEAVCEFPFYELSISKQKIFLQFMHACQTANKLILPIVGVLNMELFRNVLNAAYSYFTLVWNCVKD